MKTFEFLRSNTQNKGICTFNFGFEEDGFLKLIYMIKIRIFYDCAFQNEFLNKPFETVDIKIKTGNSFLNENPEINEISLLKIDTEGYENKVLNGFNKFFKNINVIQFEYGLANLSSRYFLFDYFNDYSSFYKIGKLYPSGVKFFEKYDLELENFIGPNFVMVRKDREDIIKILSLKYI